MQRAIALLGLFAAGCVTSRAVMLPDGSPGYYIECPRNASVCLDEAARLCPVGYNVVASGHSNAQIQNTYAQAYGSPGYASGHAITTSTPVYRGNMTIGCRARATPTPAAEVSETRL